MKNIGQMIALLRKERHLSQEALAARVQCTKQTISNYERGTRRPDYEVLEAIADVLNVPITFFLSKDEQRDALNRIYQTYPKTPPLPDGLIPIDQLPRHRVPLIGSVAAGEPIIADPEYDVYVDAPSKADYALTVQGDSMEPLYLDGDVVYIRSQPDVDDGQPAVVLIDDSAVVKRIYHMPGGLTLISENSKYPPRNITQDNCDVLRILGAIVGYTRMYRRKD